MKQGQIWFSQQKGYPRSENSPD